VRNAALEKVAENLYFVAAGRTYNKTNCFVVVLLYFILLHVREPHYRSRSMRADAAVAAEVVFPGMTSKKVDG